MYVLELVLDVLVEQNLLHNVAPAHHAFLLEALDFFLSNLVVHKRWIFLE